MTDSNGFKVPLVLVANEFEEILYEITQLHNKKRADYTGGQDILYNYETAAGLAGIDTYLLILTRMIEKCLRLSIIHKNGGTYKVEDEKPDDTSRDIAVLAVMLEIARHRIPYQDAV